MESVLYSFMVTLLHSVWQSALLLLLYRGFEKISSSSTPLYKRNVLFSILGAQLLLSVATFMLIHFNPRPHYLQNSYAVLGTSFLQQWIQENSIVLMSAYAMVVLFKMTKALSQRHRLYSFYSKDVQKAAIELRLFTKEKAFHFGIHKKVEIWLSNRVHTPLTFGFWKPIILLPISLMNQLSTAEAEALIIHELTHIKAKDYLLNWLLLGAEAIYFFNPFVHIITQKIRLEREKNCDLQVLQFPYPPILYAESLLKTAQFKQEKLNLQLAAFQNKSQLLQRIQFFTKPENTSTPYSSNKRGIPAIIAFVFLGLMMLWLCTFRVANKQQTVTMASLQLPATTFSKEMPQSFATTAVANIEIPQNKVLKTVKKKAKSTEVVPPENSDVAASNNLEEITLPAASDKAVRVIAVANTETPAPATEKQIIINEETNTGNKITTAYRVVQIDGNWYLEPLWMMKDKQQLVVDSLQQKAKNTKKDSVIVLIPTVQ